MRRRVAMAGLAALLLWVACACGPAPAADASARPASSSSQAPDQAPYRLAVGYSSAGYTKAFTRWRELVLEQTQGDVELVLYGENVLGEGKDMLLAAQRGTLSIVAASTSVGTSIIPQTAVMDIPACFPEYSQPFRIYQGEFFEALNACYNEAGLELLFLRTGEHWLISSVRPITALAQLDGMRVRTSGSAYHDQLYELLGIERVEHVGLSGLPYILDENGIDGIETTYAILKSQGLLAQQPYALKGPLFTMSSAVVMSRDAYLALPQDHQAVLKQTLGQVLRSAQGQTGGEEEGMQIHALSQEEAQQLRRLAQPLLDQIVDQVGEELVQALARENEGADAQLAG